MPGYFMSAHQGVQHRLPVIRLGRLQEGLEGGILHVLLGALPDALQRYIIVYRCQSPRGILLHIKAVEN